MRITSWNPRRTGWTLFSAGLFAGILALPILAGAGESADRVKPSTTAERAAVLRAIAAMDPDENIRNPDTLAVKFVSEAYWASRPYRRDFQTFRALIKKHNIGSYYFVNARTKHIDDLLRQALTRGVKQIVVLGAGYDSRAYRFTDVPKGVRFFEVDLPATQEEKKTRVKKILGSIPAQVVYVPIDFNTQTLEEALSNAGYDPKKKTFFIWEGVTMYLDRHGVESTLGFISRNAAPGSSVVFDYVLASVIDGTSEDAACKRGAKKVAGWGEPWLFGIKQGTARDFLDKRGLLLLSDLGPHELETLYLIGTDGRVDGPIAQCARIMHAAVPTGRITKAPGTERKEK
ncbi:MAG: class I SAM-dependent methyltransferase [Deltaproteobacteria bacterium]